MTLAAEKLTVAGRLREIGIALRPGEVTAILGPNGAGKSTLLGALAGLQDKSATGAVALNGAPLAAMNPRARACAIGYLPQSGEVAWDLTVETLVRLGRLPWRSGEAEDSAAVESALAELSLQDLSDRPLRRISGGERARALLGRVLAGSPDWILADEPLASLDLAHQLALLGCFRRLAQQGRGVVLVLHDLTQAMNHADRVVVLDSGRLVADGAPEAVLDEACIQSVWGLSARWLGEAGARALMV